jgi:DNA-binding CsgD family transcriptional regulator
VYCVRHPQQVTDLVLYGTWGRGRLRRPEKPNECEKARVMFDLCRLGWAQEGHAFLRAWASVFQPGGTAEHMRCWGELQKASTDAATAVQLMRAAAEVDVLDLAARIGCRTLIIHSDRDAVAPLDEAQRLAGRIPGARYVLLDSDNHILLAQEPAWMRFLSEIRSFLQEGSGRDERRGFDGRLASLTRREAQVLDAVARGLGNRQIATQIGVSEKTVRNNVSRIFEKLDVNTRARAIVLAREAGFGRGGEAGPASRIW